MLGAEDAKQKAISALNAGLDKAVKISRPALLKHIEQTRRRRPDASPEEIIDALGRRFTATVSGTGAAAGATAAAPGVGTGVSMALAAGDAVGFTGIAALYVFSLAEIHGIPVDEVERRRTLLLGVMLGEAGTNTVQQMAARTGPHWARIIVKKVPLTTLRQINRVLGKNFVTKYGTKQGILVLGKQVPFGIGAAIGGAGNAMFAQLTIRSALRAFGPAPETWSPDLSDGPPEEEPPEGGVLEPAPLG